MATVTTGSAAPGEIVVVFTTGRAVASQVVVDHGFMSVPLGNDRLEVGIRRDGELKFFVKFVGGDWKLPP